MKTAAEKAAALDDGLSEVHTSIALVELFYEWDWEAAEQAFRRALEINPNDAQARLYYVTLLNALQRFDESLAQIELARELDPYSIQVNRYYAITLDFLGRTEEAVSIAEAAVRASPNEANPLWYWDLANYMISQNRFEEAALWFQRQMELMEGDVMDEWSQLGYVYGMLGQSDKARVALTRLDELEEQGRYVSPVGRSLVYMGMGNRDEAFAWLEKGMATRDGWLVNLGMRSMWRPIRDDSRFDDLLRRRGLQP